MNSGGRQRKGDPAILVSAVGRDRSVDRRTAGDRYQDLRVARFRLMGDTPARRMGRATARPILLQSADGQSPRDVSDGRPRRWAGVPILQAPARAAHAIMKTRETVDPRAPSSPVGGLKKTTNHWAPAPTGLCPTQAIWAMRQTLVAKLASCFCRATSRSGSQSLFSSASFWVRRRLLCCSIGRFTA